jgi:hypothetical protein
MNRLGDAIEMVRLRAAVRAMLEEPEAKRGARLRRRRALEATQAQLESLAGSHWSLQCLAHLLDAGENLPPTARRAALLLFAGGAWLLILKILN